MTVVTLAAAAEFKTPNATMRTYASPEHGGSTVAVWRTEMAPGAAGPTHILSTEQIIVVLRGRLTLVYDDETVTLGAGDSVTVPADVPRQVRNDTDELLLTVSAALPNVTASAGDADPVPVPWTH